MNSIMNEDFKVGDKFIGLINGVRLIVKKIGLRKGYGTESGNIRQDNITYITFQDTNTGKTYETNLSNAKRLLLKRNGYQKGVI